MAERAGNQAVSRDMTNDYYWFSEPSAKHENRLLAFVNVRGFSNHVHDIDGDDEKACALVKIFYEVRKFIALFYLKDVELRFISDTFVITLPTQGVYHKGEREETDARFSVISVCRIIQCELLKLGFLSRGTIVRGNIVLNNDVIFGVALVNAYRIERKIAKYPRIIIDEGFMAILNVFIVVMMISLRLTKTE